MNKKTFEELQASLRDGGAILRGKMKPARRTVITGPEVATIRKNMELSQAAFARMMGISVDTLQNVDEVNLREATGIYLFSLYNNALSSRRRPSSIQ
jgi:DNA-binding transcriptional regulator YiaG